MENLEMSVQEISATKSHLRKSPKDFLGENANLVNLDNLMSPSKSIGKLLTVEPFDRKFMKIIYWVFF